MSLNLSSHQTDSEITPKNVSRGRNSFIPRTNVKSQMQFYRERNIQVIPLYPAQVTYSRKDLII